MIWSLLLSMVLRKDNLNGSQLLGDTSCNFHGDSVVPLSEGFVTVVSEPFTTQGPVGFCNNDFSFINTKDLSFEYTLWSNKGTILNDFRDLPPVKDSIVAVWTENGGRSTDVVVNLTSFIPGQCQDVEYLISNRDGAYFKTFDTTEPGPGGFPNFPLCHKVNVVHFGAPILETDVGVDAHEFIPFLSTAAFEAVNAGWVQWVASGSSVVIRSEF